MNEPNVFLKDTAALVEQYHRSIREDFAALPAASVWNRPVGGQVSPANLVLHLTGNLRHFFGHLLGGSDYQRTRDREFLEEPWADRDEILGMWDEACTETARTLRELDPARLAEPAPVDKFPGGVPVSAYILRLAAHMAYHGGQIRSYYRLLVPDP